MYARVNARAARQPLATAMTAGGAKCVGCDMAVQMADGRDRLDRQRVGAFAAFGTLYAGGAQFFFFNKLVPWVLPHLKHGWRRAPGSVFLAASFDVFVHMPFLYLPVFYTMREVAYHPGSPDVVLTDAFAHYRTGIRSDFATSLAIFGPVQLVNFGVSPAHLRVPILLTVGLLWTTILSVRHGGRG